MNETMCRLCGEENILDLYLINFSKVVQLFPEIMSDNNKLPSRACELCSKSLDMCSKFYSQVLVADEKLRKILMVDNDSEKNNDRESAVIISRKENPFKCPHCHKAMSSKLALRNHVKTDHPNEAGARRFSCRVCSVDFRLAADRNEHEVVHKGETPYLCHQCGKAFPRSNNLRIHMSTHSANRRKYSCNMCDKSFLTRRFLSWHQNMHTGLKPFSCDLCGKNFQGKGHLRQHINIHMGQSFPCHLCGKTFSRKGNRSAHIKQSHASPSQSNEEKVLQVLLEGTMKVSKEEKPKKFNCKRCKETFDDESSLKEHKGVHVDITECNICGKKYQHHGSLTYHRRVAHTGERPFRCTELKCDMSFPLKAMLLSHVRRVHTNEKPFLCEEAECGKAFHTAANLHAHSNVHSPNFSFTCELCGKTLAQKKSLLVHLKTHTEGKKLKCSICSAGFTQKSNLKRHEKKHSAKSRPFFCKFCGESFALKSDSGKHALCRSKLLPSEPNDLGDAEKILDLVVQNHCQD